MTIHHTHTQGLGPISYQMERLRNFILGSPLKNSDAKHERLGFWLGFPLLSVDTVSSLAYATEEILIPLSVLGTNQFYISLEIVAYIIILFFSLVFSYMQTVKVYPEGGGSYGVAKENLGDGASLLGGNALIIDYILTVAVSVSAAVRAITSAFHFLKPFQTILCVGCIFALGWLNLRGTKESAKVVSSPVYLFMILLGALCIGGFILLTPEGMTPHAPAPINEPDLPMTFATIFIILRAFSGGCTAMTGIEAVATSSKALAEPCWHTAQKILLGTGMVVAFSFLMITNLVFQWGLHPNATESLLSQLARGVFGNGYVYMTFQFMTTFILLLAANTAFSGSPRLAATMAKDGWLPKQMAFVGDRLVFTYGIVWLSLIAVFLVIAFKGDTHALIPLYAVGVFIAFFINQTGMFAHWKKERKRTGTPYTLNMAVNVLGITLTTIALSVTFIAKFHEGAYLVLIALPIMIFICYRIRNHYREFEEDTKLTPVFLSTQNTSLFTKENHRTLVVPISRLHRGAYQSLIFARELSADVKAVIVDFDQTGVEELEKQIKDLNWGIEVVVLGSPYRSVINPIVNYVHELDRKSGNLTTIILPEVIPTKSWQNILHNKTAEALTELLVWDEYRPNKARIIINVPFHLQESHT